MINNTGRLRFRALGKSLCREKKRIGLMLSVFLLVIVFSLRFSLGINLTESLPGTVFLIDQGDRHVIRGKLYAFAWQGSFIPQGITVIKALEGLPGDRVEHRPRKEGFTVSINGCDLALAKPRSRLGASLHAGFTGTIPSGHYYAHAPHPDSLDSRYAETGLIDQTQIKGRAYRLF